MAKRFLVFLLVAVLTVSILVACTPQAETVAPVEEESSAPAAQEQSAEPAESSGEAAPSDLTADLTMWKYPRFDGEEAFFDEEVMAEFNKLYPNVTITTTIIPWDGGPEKVNIAIAAGTTPDILHDTTLRQKEYATKGVLVPLTDVIGANAENMPEKWQNSVNIDGEQYLAPTNTAGGTAMMINYALAEELGVADMLPEDHVSWTWDECYAFCKAATEAGKSQGIYGIAMFAGSQSSDTNTMGWIMGSGSKVLNDDMTAVTLNSAEGAQALEFMSSLSLDGIAMPGATTLIDDEIIELFLGGKVVISAYADLWMVNEAYNRVQSGDITGPMDAQFYLFPTIDGTPKVYTGYPSEGFAVFNNGDDDKIAAAKAYIDFVLDSEWEAAYVEKAGQNATREGYELYTDKPEVSREVARMGGWADYYLADWGSALPYWAEIRSIFYPEIQAAYGGQKDAQTALNDFAANADKIIAGNQ